MSQKPHRTVDPTSPNIIRTETALTRYPIHRLAKRGNIEIEIKQKNQNGETICKWEVDYSKKRGQPGPLAYKLDALVINRKIGEEGKPVPKVICLGSLRDIADRTGAGEGNTNKER